MRTTCIETRERNIKTDQNTCKNLICKFNLIFMLKCSKTKILLNYVIWYIKHVNVNHISLIIVQPSAPKLPSRCISKGNFKLTWWDSTVDVIESLKDALGSLDLPSLICETGNQTNNSITRLFFCKFYISGRRGIIRKHHSDV